jgi:hypothetical protein
MDASTFLVVVLMGAIVLFLSLVFVYRLIMVVPLASTLEPDEREPVAILDGLGEMEAEILRSRLEIAGIPAFKRNSHIAPTIEYIPPFGWEVLIRYGDRFDAERCLGRRLLTSEPEADDVETAESP